MIIPTTESTLRMTLMQLSETKLELTTVTEQRDRLAEALERIGEEDGSPMSMRVCSTKSLVKQALQPLNPDHTVDANDMIAAVKGGSNE